MPQTSYSSTQGSRQVIFQHNVPDKSFFNTMLQRSFTATQCSRQVFFNLFSKYFRLNHGSVCGLFPGFNLYVAQTPKHSKHQIWESARKVVQRQIDLSKQCITMQYTSVRKAVTNFLGNGCFWLDVPKYKRWEVTRKRLCGA